MSYPAPTQPLHPERREAIPQPPRAPRTAKTDEFVPYPPPTTGVGHPIKFAPIAPVNIWAGETYQLIPALWDVEGNLQTPAEKLRFVSNNPRVLVSDTGLISTNVPPTIHSRRGSSETATIQILHGGINTSVPIVVRTDFNDIVSD
jgi:hypothetical protein